MNSLRRTECLLMLLGVLCAGYCSFVGLEASASSRAGEKFGAHAPVVSANASSVGSKTTATVMGRLDIPGISLSVPILSDYDSSSLLKGVGHIPGTALPGGLGTLGLAGHRDTFFRPLRNIKTNMNVQIADPEGVYHYVVDSTEIVKPEKVEVLDIGSRPELTLITCYPFNYVGAAPLRFIVHAHLLSASPDAVQ